MKTKCCRSSPRCAGCPALAVAAARRERQLTETATLVAEILGDRPAPHLPPAVVQALDRLQRARRRAHTP
jgi:hypothetical protein